MQISIDLDEYPIKELPTVLDALKKKDHQSAKQGVVRKWRSRVFRREQTEHGQEIMANAYRRYPMPSDSPQLVSSGEIDKFMEFLEQSGLRRLGITPSDPEYRETLTKKPPLPPSLNMDPRLVEAYSQETADHPRYGLPSLAVLDPRSEYSNLLETYYFQLRNSVSVVLDTKADHRDFERIGRKIVQAFRYAALDEAVLLANFQCRWNKIVIPWWFENVVTEFSLNLEPDLLNLWQSLDIRLDQRRALTAFVTQRAARLDLSVLINAYLKSFNICLFNMADAIRQYGPKQFAVDRPLFMWNLLAHLWMFREDFSLMNVPHVRPFSQDGLAYSKRFAHLQILFLILHELGHLALRHDERTSCGSSAYRYLRELHVPFDLSALEEGSGRSLKRTPLPLTGCSLGR